MERVEAGLMLRSDIRRWYKGSGYLERVKGKANTSAPLSKKSHTFFSSKGGIHTAHIDKTHTHSLEQTQDKFNDKLMVLLEIFDT